MSWSEDIIVIKGMKQDSLTNLLVFFTLLFLANWHSSFDSVMKCIDFGLIHDENRARQSKRGIVREIRWKLIRVIEIPILMQINADETESDAESENAND